MSDTDFNYGERPDVSEAVSYERDSYAEHVEHSALEYRDRMERFADPRGCPNCVKGRPVPCSVGCRTSDVCCDKSLKAPCSLCAGSGRLAA